MLGIKFQKTESSQFVDIEDVKGVTYEKYDNDEILITIDPRIFGTGSFEVNLKIGYVKV